MPTSSPGSSSPRLLCVCARSYGCVHVYIGNSLSLSMQAIAGELKNQWWGGERFMFHVVFCVLFLRLIVDASHDVATRDEYFYRSRIWWERRDGVLCNVCCCRWLFVCVCGMHDCSMYYLSRYYHSIDTWTIPKYMHCFRKVVGLCQTLRKVYQIFKLELVEYAFLIIIL